MARKRSLLGGGLVLAVGVSAAVACGNYVPPDVGTYGPPNGLSGKVPLAPEGNDSGSGTPTPTGDGGGTPPGGTTYACQTAGGTIVDGGTCSVSFATDIYPKMIAGGTWGCGGTTGGCHGATTASPPVLSTATGAAAYYAAFADYVQADNGSKPYFNPCSTDPAQSGFVCNTLAQTATGVCGSSMPSGAPVSSADQTTIAAWVACGAPNN